MTQTTDTHQNAREVIEIAPQPGPQTAFVESEADIVIYGGAAGGGKTYGLLIDPLRHYSNGDVGATIFRKTSVQVRVEGGLWDESMKTYSLISGTPREHALSWRFPSGFSVSFANLEHENDVYNYQGAQIPWIGFDELTHFTKNQFFYMLSRNRSTSGIKPRIRATCNPDPDSWVKDFIIWWLDDAGRFPRPERSGVMRWFIRLNDAFHWADTREELVEQFSYLPEVQPKSVTFISARLEDNQILMQKDPSYLGNLLAMNRVDRARLREGDWNARVSAGSLFKREWFQVLDTLPGGHVAAIRFWDRAATKPSETNRDPDWTRGLKLYKYPDNTFTVVDLKSLRDTPGQVERLVSAVASHDSQRVRIMSQQDPGSAGVSEAEHFIRMLAGFDVRVETMSKDKITRAKPVSAQAEAGNIRVLRAAWNEDFFSELENFPDGKHDDIVDVLSGAFNQLCGGLSLADVL